MLSLGGKPLDKVMESEGQVTFRFEQDLQPLLHFSLRKNAQRNGLVDSDWQY